MNRGKGKGKQSAKNEFKAKDFERPGLSSDEIEEIKEAFDIFDVDKSGSISVAELLKAMTTLGFDSKNPAIFNMISDMDEDGNGEIEFDRMDTHRRAVETENEAFFLRITNKDDYLYEGADMGILVTRGRMMTDDFELTDRAKTWINAIHGKYSSVLVEDHREATNSGAFAK